MQAKTRIRFLLLDIEGTTTPVEFVYGTLFPYARTHLRDFLLKNLSSDVLRADLAALREDYVRDMKSERTLPLWSDQSTDSRVDSIVRYVQWLMDRDRKSTPMKSIQGRIWHSGYLSGELKGRLYPDVPPAFRRWRDQDRRICIFSSGSVQAQELLFGHSDAGDLTGYIERYFDTATGAKREASSYRRIAHELECPPSEMLFISDVVEELDAAAQAEMATTLAVRSGVPDRGLHTVIQSFDEVFS